jgi:hypothetical protein
MTCLIVAQVKKVSEASFDFDSDVLSAIENNGEVTLPRVRIQSLVSKRRFRIFLFVVGLLAIGRRSKQR